MTLEPSPLRLGGRTPIGVLNIAHRGGRAFAPENTLAAFEKAKLFGCPMFEIDVHMAKDGELVVHHDDQLTRCTNARVRFPRRSTYYISDFSYDELSLLDAGSWYVDQLSLSALQRQAFLQELKYEELEQFVSAQDRELYASGEIKVPTLKQTLELALRLDIMVNIELKTLPRMYPELADSVVTLIESLGMERRVLISSFDHEQLVTVRRRTHIIATGVLTSDRLAFVGEYLQLIDADAYHPGCYGGHDSLGFNSVSGKLDSCVITRARACGHGVNVWTCNDKNEMRQLIAAGVTGLLSDYPNRVREVLAEQRSQRS